MCLVSGNRWGLGIPGRENIPGKGRNAHPSTGGGGGRAHAEPAPELQGRRDRGCSRRGLGHAAARGRARITDTGAGRGAIPVALQPPRAGGSRAGARRAGRGRGRAGRCRSRVGPGAHSHGRYSLTADTGAQSVSALGNGTGRRTDELTD